MPCSLLAIQWDCWWWGLVCSNENFFPRFSVGVQNLIIENEYMHIEIELDSIHSNRLQQLQEIWRQSLDQAIANLIDIGYMLKPEDSTKFTGLASENVLKRDWDTPEEEAAWAHL